MELEAQLSDRDVTIELTDGSRSWLAKKGYNPKFGARPLARVIQEFIKRPLSEELLFGRLSKGGWVKVSEKNNQLSFRYKKHSDKNRANPEIYEKIQENKKYAGVYGRQEPMSFSSPADKRVSFKMEKNKV